AIDPPLILLDEPASNLDTEGKAIAAQLITKALASHKTLVIASNESWETEYATHKINLS
ncbi:ABC transporter ATP-binding protein, partial [Anaerospora sp.]